MYHHDEKQMKSISRVLMIGLLALAFTACSEEDPTIRIKNDLDVKVNVQLKPDAGSTININDVAAGTISDMVTVQEGGWSASASVQSSSAEPSAVFVAENDMEYTLVIKDENGPMMEVQSQGK